IADFADLYADAATDDLAGLAQLLDDTHGLVDGNGERYAHEPAAARHDLGVDAHHPAIQIDQRPAGITGIDRDVRLDEGKIVARIATNGADDARGHGGVQAERRTESQHPLSLAHRRRIADAQHRRIIDVHLEQGDIR